MNRHTRPFKAGTPGSARFRRSGFSLVELMIAVVVLGLGMVMIATMFPVAWNRARRLSESSTRMSVPHDAHVQVSLMARVDGSDTNRNTFAGDRVYDADNRFTDSDTRVHALHMENLATNPQPQVMPEYPSRVELIATILGVNDADLEQAGDDIFEGRIFTSPQVRFEQRLYPSTSLRPRTPEDAMKFKNSDPDWDAALDARRFAWALLHRLRHEINNDDDRRDFDLFYVTLRRPKSTAQYAIQDPGSAPHPASTESPMFSIINNDPILPITPMALNQPQDFVVLPVAWRVQLYFPDIDASPSEPRGSEFGPKDIPTEVWANKDGAQFSESGSDIIVDMFPTGADFVDELNGNVYRVVKRTIVGEDQDRARLTLDREVFVEDVIDVDPLPLPLSFPEHLRTVWVYPPAVNEVDNNGRPTFEGSEPVVGIDVRTLTLSPN